MAGRRKVGTSPELALRRVAHRRGLRYRVNVLLSERCRPDILFRRSKVAVFVDGCFWHGCPTHGQANFRGPNRALWEAKIARNERNDCEANETAMKLGFAVLRLWECEVVAAPGEAVDRIESAVHRSTPMRGP